MDVNTVTLTGRLTRDSELSHKGNGITVCEFSIANNYRRKTGDIWVQEVNYFDLAVFGRTAQALHPILTQGFLVGVDAELRQNRWEQDGKKRVSNDLVVKKVHLLSSCNKGLKENLPESDDYDFEPPSVPDEYPPEEESFDLDS
jgi:single-strand DNA-binding protein